MKPLIAFALGILVLFACSDTHQQPEEKSTINQSQEPPKVTPTAMLRLEVEGMSCELGCGATIREALVETGGVSRVKFQDFDATKETNTTLIYFNKDKISSDKIAAIVNRLNDHQFKVKAERFEDYTEPSSYENEETTVEKRSSPTSAVNIETSTTHLPNLFDLLRSVLM